MAVGMRDFISQWLTRGTDCRCDYVNGCSLKISLEQDLTEVQEKKSTTWCFFIFTDLF